MMRRFNLLVQELNNAYGIENMIHDEENTCWLTFNRNITVKLQYIDEGEQLTLLGIVGELPEVCNEKIALNLLHENFNWIGTGGGTLSVSPDNRKIYFGYIENIQTMDFVRLQNLLINFVGNCEKWQKYIMEMMNDGYAKVENKQSTEQFITLRG